MAVQAGANSQSGGCQAGLRSPRYQRTDVGGRAAQHGDGEGRPGRHQHRLPTAGARRRDPRHGRAAPSAIGWAEPPLIGAKRTANTLSPHGFTRTRSAAPHARTASGNLDRLQILPSSVEPAQSLRVPHAGAPDPSRAGRSNSPTRPDRSGAPSSRMRRPTRPRARMLHPSAAREKSECGVSCHSLPFSHSPPSRAPRPSPAMRRRAGVCSTSAWPATRSIRASPTGSARTSTA